MSNSRWKPWDTLPDKAGSYLVYAPDRSDGRKPYLTGNVTMAVKKPIANGGFIVIIEGRFYFDAVTPTHFCEINDIVEQVPIQARQVTIDCKRDGVMRYYFHRNTYRSKRYENQSL